jgi:hypothetical protein
VRFVYKPEGADVREWDLDFESMPASEWILIEKKAGFASGQFAEAMKNGSMLATKALLWVLMKRTMSTLSWDALDFSMSEIDLIEDDEDEDDEVDDEVDPKA